MATSPVLRRALRLPAKPAVRRVARIAAMVLAVVVIAIAGVLLGMRLAGSQTYTTELGTVRLEIQPSSSGQVDAYIPITDWGIRADAFSGPLKLLGELRSVDRSAVLRAAGGDDASLDRARNQLDAAAGSMFLREALFAAGGALLVAIVAAFVLAALKRPRRRVLLATVGAIFGVGLLAIVVAVWSARTTFNPEAFDHPQFYAHGAELRQLLDAASHSEERADNYRNKVKGTLVRLSDLLASSGVGGEPSGSISSGRRALLASDLHANTLVLDAVEQLAAPARPVFFVGDFGHQGSEAEVRLVAPRLRRLGSRVIAVSGNHDSTQLMERLAEVGVTVLTTDGRLHPDGTTDRKQVIDVMGMRVAGWSDPLEWHGADPDDPKRIFSFSELPDGDERFAQAEDDLVKWYDALPEPPDVVLVHENGLAQHLADVVSKRPQHHAFTILTGHDHKQHVDRHGDIVVIDAGSVGAGGVLGIADEQVGIGDLHFAPAGPSVQAVDLIEADPFSGAAQAQRVIVAGNQCDEGETECQLFP